MLFRSDHRKSDPTRRALNRPELLRSLHDQMLVGRCDSADDSPGRPHSRGSAQHYGWGATDGGLDRRVPVGRAEHAGRTDDAALRRALCIARSSFPLVASYMCHGDRRTQVDRTSMALVGGFAGERTA